MQKRLTPSILFIVTVIPVFFFSCSSGQESNRKMDKEEIKEHLIKANKIFIVNEAGGINDYIERHGLVMDTTPTGLRVKVERTGRGKHPAKENRVTVNYIVSLLDGTECYRSDSAGALTFGMSYDDVPRGLRETVGMMAVGDKALAILPSHLAYGFTGDGKKIPSNSSLVYQVELLKIE